MLRFLPQPYRNVVKGCLIAILIAMVLGIALVALSGHYPHRQAAATSTTQPTTQGSPPASGAPGQSSPAAGSPASSSPAASPGSTSANCPTTVPGYVNDQLTKFLLAYDSLTPHETDAQRAALLKPLVPSAVYKTLDLTVSGPPPGTTVTPHISTETLCGQSPTGQLYITEAVVEKVESPGQPVTYNTDSTDTIWVQKGGIWTMISFNDEVYQGAGG